MPATGAFYFLVFCKNAHTSQICGRIFGCMSKKYTTEELARIYDKKDWETLWKITEPMIAHEVRRCVCRGELALQYARDDDLLQEARLAAWKCLTRWNAFESGLRTWVGQAVRSAVRDTVRRAGSGMIGGRDSGVSIAREFPEEDDDQDEGGVVARIPVYETVPEGLFVPGADSQDQAIEYLLSTVPSEYRDMVIRLCGIGVPAETQEEYARAVGVSKEAMWKRVSRLRAMLALKINAQTKSGLPENPR